MNGIERIAAERARHAELGYDEAHDDRHHNASMAKAAACYAAPGKVFNVVPRDDGGFASVELWPWSRQDDHREHRNKSNFEVENDPDLIEARIHDLERAGALAAAEIDRLLKVKARVEARKR